MARNKSPRGVNAQLTSAWAKGEIKRQQEAVSQIRANRGKDILRQTNLNNISMAKRRAERRYK